MPLTQYKQHRDEVGVGELITIQGDALKKILLLWCEHEPDVKTPNIYLTTLLCCRKQQLQNKKRQIPVTHTEKQINPTKHQKLFVKQPVDASLPPEQELGEATKPGIGHFERVGNCHVWFIVCGYHRNPCKISKSELKTLKKFSSYIYRNMCLTCVQSCCPGRILCFAVAQFKPFGHIVIN